MKNHLLLLLCFISFQLSAQTFNIKGVVEDTLKNPLISSTVILMEKADSTMVDFTRTELDGSFLFRKVPNGKYIVKSTYLGYIPLSVNASSENGDNVDLGIMKMTEIASELFDVVIKAAKAPIKMRGDTIEYDASTFQVPEGSSVEELLKRLPGIEVDQDGSILADGTSVDKVTVDGKNFFGSDPKAATKNLPAEGISKVQVFDTKTEEEKITGSVGEADSKTMNLQLKDDFKKGSFGRVTGGVGTESRAELKGNINRFNEKIQLSLVGVANNTGRNGLSWDDYQDFMGSNSFNFSDDTDYGFGGGNRRFFSFGGGGNSLENSIQNIFFNNSNQGGFPENYNGGVNFNYDHKKTKLTTVYYYNQAGLNRNTTSSRQNFITESIINNETETFNDDISKGHRGEISLEQELDSLHSIKIDFNTAVINEYNLTSSDINLSNNDILTSESSFDNDKDTYGYLYNASAVFRKKFKKTGRRMGLNASYLLTALDKTEDQISTSNFFDESGQVDSISNTIRNNVDNADKNLFKANALFVEPLNKVFFSQTFYNFSNRIETGDRTVNDIQDGSQKSLNEFLSRDYSNTIQLNRVGTSLRYSNKGLNVSVGLAYQQFNLYGDYQGKGNSGISGLVDETFINWIPNFSLDYSPKRRYHMSLNYGVNASEPEISQLQPIVDNSNPLFLYEGNPQLTPEISHYLSTRISRYFPISQIRYSVNLSYDLFTNNIITEETVDENLITFTRPINYDGGDRVSLYSYFSFPIVKGKLKGSVNFRSNFANSFAFVNNFLNKTQSTGYYPSVNLTFTPTKKTSIYLRGNWGIIDTKYEINTSQDQLNINNTYNVTANSILFWGLYVNSSFNYQTFSNDRFGFQQNVPILNASIYKQFLKGNKMEIRLSLYDAFNRNLNVSQFASGNSVFQSQTTALGRYAMLSLSYNIKGLKSGVEDNGHWW